jgi:hypothetical protein
MLIHTFILQFCDEYSMCFIDFEYHNVFVFVFVFVFVCVWCGCVCVCVCFFPFFFFFFFLNKLKRAKPRI